jgi:hypothetical protein
LSGGAAGKLAAVRRRQMRERTSPWMEVWVTIAGFVFTLLILENLYWAIRYVYVQITGQPF